MTEDVDLRAASKRFYAAVNTLLQGSVEQMLAVWSHSPDASYCDTRSDIVFGWPAIEAYWRAAAAVNATAHTRIHVTEQIQHLIMSEHLAYVVTLEQIQRDGDPDIMTARATHIYRLEDDSHWRLLHRHADASPKLSHI